MKILIIPDVHGRDFWKKPCKDMSQWDKVVFLGDYVDPYPGEATQEDVLTEIKDIVALKEVYKDKVILLWGNHDLFYWCQPYMKEFEYKSRHDYDRHNDIEKLFIQHNDLFQFAWQHDKFLFTHAGVHNVFAKLLVEEFDEVNADCINEFFSHSNNQTLLAMVSWYRGGYDDFGSIVWADIREHYGVVPNKYLKDYFQIFGHSYCKEQIITKYFAMLDVGYEYAFIEDGILKDKNGYKFNITSYD